MLMHHVATLSALFLYLILLCCAAFVGGVYNHDPATREDESLT